MTFVESAEAHQGSGGSLPVTLASNVAAGDRLAVWVYVYGSGITLDHVSDGLGNEGKFPKLAGQSPDYIIKQVHDFRSGARNHQTMYLMATAVSDEDLADIAAYFGSVERMHGEAHTTPPLAARLYLEGDAERAIVPCAGCHGEHGQGLPGNGPVLGGQHRRYLQKQLLDWRAHERSNHADGTMNRIAAALSDTEIEALADYLAAQ
mgnify:CR=1 FL=1